MDINQIRLTNFKLFENLKIDTKKLTLLTGSNSSGKSSVINALTAILQTEQPHQYPFEFVSNGTNCSLGSYKDIVNGHNTKKAFGIGFCASHQKRHYCLDASYRYSPRGDHILLRAMSYKFDKDKLGIKWMGVEKGYSCHLSAPSLREMRSDKTFQNFFKALEQMIVSTTKKYSKKDRAKIKLLSKQLAEAPYKRTVSVSRYVSPRDLPNKIHSYLVGSFLLDTLRRRMEEYQQTVRYIGPVRAEPLRYYSPDRPYASIDPSGTNSPQLLHDWQKHDPKRFTEVSKLLATLELTGDIRAQSDADDILKMLAKPFDHRETVNLADVGFGVSQALPLVVADVSLPDDSVLLVNQPEVHLHPTAQAQLANYFTSRLKKRQYIVETHSEYFINRLRVLVQQGKINPEEIAIIFFHSSPRAKSLVKKYDIQLQKDGSLKGAPKAFFRTYYTDSFALAMGSNAK